jgi:hypothetical protein
MGLYGGLALIAVLISAWRHDVDIYRIEGVSTPTRLVWSPLVGIAVGIGVVGLSRLLTRRFEWARRLHRDFRDLLGPLTLREIAILAAASSIGEELLFRGALLPWLGLWPQALVFALLHVGPGARYLPWTLWAMAMGLVFGVMVLWSGDLGGAITAHFTINFLNLLHIARVELPPERSGTGAPYTEAR